MFDKLKQMFGRDPVTARPELDPHIAATALLVEAALADGIYADCEQDQIKEILSAAFLLDPAAVDRVLDQAEELAEGAIDHHRFTKVVKVCLSEQERVALIEQLWMVALADGEKSPFEDAFVRRIAPLLGIADRERVFARARAEAKVRHR
ncbi:TerB family tellurite resistance protein [Maricaulis sp.]|uniref:tellurite resistance TerB family protein n=1 Tax=Maricaulis sp. TaxID=1486257 RepID=UPI003A8F037C|tara:strand:+ start:852 stop:1301 length:450 start_codon:yes stop_codon:yes gene_type:complete